MDHIFWMDYSGAPAIFIPENLLPGWNGFFTPVNEQGDRLPDLELADGRQYNICDDFDFSHPQTDYDKLCAHLEQTDKPYALFPIIGGEILAISDGYDVWGWWAEQQILLTGGKYVPNIMMLNELDWRNEVAWHNPAAKVMLMNACLHGAEPQMGEATGQFTRITLEAGKYLMSTACFESLNFYRFQQLVEVPALRSNAGLISPVGVAP